MLNFKTKIMKKNTTILVSTIVVMLLFFTGCKKKTDIREQYIGDWEFYTIITLYNRHTVPEIIQCDTFSYLGKITLGNSSEHALTIQYTENNVIETYIDEKGGIYVPSCPCAKYVCTRGNFKGNNKMHLNFGSSSESHNIIGTKKKGDKQ